MKDQQRIVPQARQRAIAVSRVTGRPAFGASSMSEVDLAARPSAMN
jgi:hypothetical protein